MNTISLSLIFNRLRRFSRPIFTLSLATAALAAIVSCFVLTPRYRAHAVMLISNQAPETEISHISTDDMNAAAMLAVTYQSLFLNETSLKETVLLLQSAYDITKEDILRTTTVSVTDSTPILTVSVTADDRNLAADIANALSLSAVNNPVIPACSVTIVEYATPSSSAVFPNHLQNIVFGFLIGAIGASFFFIIYPIPANKPSQTDQKESKK